MGWIMGQAIDTNLLPQQIMCPCSLPLTIMIKSPINPVRWTSCKSPHFTLVLDHEIFKLSHDRLICIKLADIIFS